MLAEEKWKQYWRLSKIQLLTEVGLRSLSGRDKGYKQDTTKICGRATPPITREPSGLGSIARFVMHGASLSRRLRIPSNLPQGFEEHLYEDGIGTISEIFDAESPFPPEAACLRHGAEVLRCKLLLEQEQARGITL